MKYAYRLVSIDELRKGDVVVLHWGQDETKAVFRKATLKYTAPDGTECWKVEYNRYRSDGSIGSVFTIDFYSGQWVKLSVDIPNQEDLKLDLKGSIPL